MYLFGAVEPATGENFFLIFDKSDTENMNVFLNELSKEYKDDIIILVCDNAPWHGAESMIVPENIIILKLSRSGPKLESVVSRM